MSESQDSAVIRAHYGPDEERQRDELRRYGFIRCVLAAAWSGDIAGPAEAPGPCDGDGSYEEVARVIAVSQWMEDEQFARQLGLDVDAIITEDDGGLEDAIATRLDDWKRAAPPVDLPPALASIDDVRQVCEAAGLTDSRADAWTDEGHVDVLSGPAFHDGRCIVMCHAAPWSVDLRGGSPTVLLWSAIQAARSES